MEASSSSLVQAERLFFRIGDVARLLGVKPHVLRYWETEFPMISPQKSQTGQRVYRRTDLELMFLIKRLVHVEGYSIEGARKKIQQLRRQGQLQGSRRFESKREQLMILTQELKDLGEVSIGELFHYPMHG